MSLGATKAKVIAIGGTTASGKTSLAIEAAKRFGGEVVNCDSRQIYTKLAIGTAKPEIGTRYPDGTVTVDGVRHYLLDLVDPREDYSLAQFQKDAANAIGEILSSGKVPILAGGTGLYLDSLLHGYDLEEEETDKSKRKELQELSKKELQAMIMKEAPDIYGSLNNSDRNNPHRLIRAIERSRNVYKGEITSTSSSTRWAILYLVLDPAPDELSERISERTAEMFEAGLLEENARLREEGLTTDMPALKTIGYQEFDDYFSGKLSLEETQERIELHTLQYAKRQRTWFKRNKEAVWVRDSDEGMEHIASFLRG